MPDSIEAPEPEALDTPVEESTAPLDEGHGEPDAPENWEKRYQDLQPAYTKASMEAAELRQQMERLRSDEQAQREFLAELGYELPEDETGIEDDAEIDPISALAQEVAQLKQAREQEAQAAYWSSLETHVEGALKAYGEERGFPLSEEENSLLIGAILTAPKGEDGLPPVKAVTDMYAQIQDNLKKAWVDSKQAPAAPTGVAATEMPDYDNDRARLDHMTRKWMDMGRQ
jgi:hypothetical protein